MHSNRRAILGVFLVIIGGVLLLDNLNILPGLPRQLFSWPILLILIGVFNLFTGNRGAAIILIAIGGVFFVQRFTHFYFDFRTWWPAVLVVIGLAFILRKRSGNLSSGEISDKSFDDLNLFGGSKKRITSPELHGGQITSVFGGSEIDLRDATPVDGAVIEVFTLFGGCKLIIPPHWNVSIETTAILGGFDDKREPSKGTSDYTVYIKGVTILGGGEIKSAR
jgi:predicted membrane protein